MAGIFANVDSDIQKLQKLKQEIENVKKSLKSINVKVDIDIAQGLEAQLKSLTTQYDALAAKVGETEARITASANKIINASNKIIQAQDKMSQAAGINTSSSTNTNSSTNASETTSIQAQVKAYEELKAEIGDVLGTRGQNIKRLIEEQNAIRLLNAEIKKITKSQGESSSLSSAQQRRLEQLNNSLLTHKTALAEVRLSLSANAKLDNAAATSMDALSQSLGRMRATYRALTESERTSPFGKELLVSIQQADAKIKELDATIGNHQRNVGNYASGWNGLSMSIQQIGRELPSLAVGWSTFFLAISNNLPILADEIKRARIQFEALKKSGQAATPVWKQVVSSIVSWQTALTVGITLLTLYGDKLVKWISSLGKAEEAIKNLYTAQRDLYNVTSTGIEQSSKEITKLNSLYKIATDVTRTTKERNDAVKELKRSFPSHLRNLSDESIKNGEVAKSIKEQTRQIIANAKASVAADQIAKNWYKSFQAGVAKNIALLQKQRLEQNLLIAEQRKEEYSTINNPGAYDWASKQVDLIKESIEETDKEIKKQEALQDSYQKSSKALEKLVTVAGLGGKYEDPDKNYNSILDQQKKIADLLDQQALERKRKEEDIEYQVAQAKIDAMAEGEAKIRAQRDLDNKKEIQDLERQREDYIRTEIEYQRKLFDAREELNVKKNKNYKKKTFDPSSVKVDTSSIDATIGYVSKRQINDQIRNQEEAWNEYYIEYGKYQEKRVAIMEKYDKQIAKVEEGSAAKATLTAQRKKELDDLDKELLDSSELWSDFFTDFSNRSSSSIRSIIEDIQELIDYMNGVEGASIPDIFEDNEKAVKAINDAMSNPEALKKFTSNLESSIKKFKKMLDEDNPFKQISEGFKTKDSEGISKGFQGIASAAKELTSILEELGVESDSTAGKVASVLGNTASYAATGASVGGPWGAIIGGAIGMATGLVGVLGADYSAYNEMVAKYDVLLDVWDQLLDKKKAYINESYGAEATKAGKEALDLLKAERDITRELASSRLDAGASAGSHSMAYRMWQGSYKYEGQNWKDVAGEISSALGGVEFSNMWNLLYMSADQLEWIKTNYSGLWSQMDTDFRGYLDDIIQYGETEAEIIESVKEQITGISFDSFRDSYVSLLSDLDSTNKDFADSFEEYLRKSILQSVISKNYDTKIQELYDSWSKAGEDGLFSESEVDRLRSMQQSITDAMLAERDRLEEVFGWSSSSSQEASKKGFATASQDSIDELNGRFTALQIAGEEIKNQNQLQTMSILELRADMLPIIANTTGIKDIASETRDLLRLSYEELTGIHDDTTSMNKSLKNIETDIAEVKRNTNGLSKR